MKKPSKDKINQLREISKEADELLSYSKKLLGRNKVSKDAKKDTTGAPVEHTHATKEEVPEAVEGEEKPAINPKGGEGAGPGSTDDYWLHEDVMSEGPDGSNTWTFDLELGKMVKKKKAQ